MILESSNEVYRINFRSSGNYTVNDIAQSFNGGGHKFASGAIINNPLDSVVKNAVEKMKKSILEQRSGLV